MQHSEHYTSLHEISPTTVAPSQTTPARLSVRRLNVALGLMGLGLWAAAGVWRFYQVEGEMLREAQAAALVRMQTADSLRAQQIKLTSVSTPVPQIDPNPELPVRPMCGAHLTDGLDSTASNAPPTTRHRYQEWLNDDWGVDERDPMATVRPRPETRLREAMAKASPTGLTMVYLASTHASVATTTPSGPIAELTRWLPSNMDGTAHFIRPLKLSSTTCLRCHSPLQARATPPVLGETIGMQVVTMPLMPLQRQRWAQWSASMWGYSVVILLGMIGARWGIGRWILRPARHAARTWQTLAMEDMLTGLPNRRQFEQAAQQAAQEAERTGTRLSMALVDLDHFKRINDQFGQVTGDVVLQEVAKRLRQLTPSSAVPINGHTMVASTDADTVMSTELLRVSHTLLARWGGEEFAVLLPDAGLQDAILWAEQAVAAMSGALFDGVGRLSVSVGVADLHEAESWQAMFAVADQGLVKAKRQGGAQVAWTRHQCPMALPSEEQLAKTIPLRTRRESEQDVLTPHH